MIEGYRAVEVLYHNYLTGLILTTVSRRSGADAPQAIVEGAMLGTYRFDRYLKEKSDKVIQAFDPCWRSSWARGRWG